MKTSVNSGKARQLVQSASVCMHACRGRQGCWGSMWHAFEEWGQLSINNWIEHYLVEQKMLVSVVFCLLFWNILPFLLYAGSSSLRRQKRAMKANPLVIFQICVSKEGFPKRKTLIQSWVPERFLNSWCFSFEKYVEEMVLRVEVLIFGDFNLC